MRNKLKALNKEEMQIIDSKLQAYDDQYIKDHYEGTISLGYYDEDSLVGGVCGEITTFNILYISTLFVEEEYRRRGMGRTLMAEIEKMAKERRVNLIRLDTFDWQGKEFYMSIGYELAGSYENKKDNYSEYFFYKHI